MIDPHNGSGVGGLDVRPGLRDAHLAGWRAEELRLPHTHAHTCAHTHWCAHTHTGMHTRVHILVSAHTYAHVHTHTLHTRLVLSVLPGPGCRFPVMGGCVSFLETEHSGGLSQRVGTLRASLAPRSPCVFGSHKLEPEFSSRVPCVPGVRARSRRGAEGSLVQARALGLIWRGSGA